MAGILIPMVSTEKREKRRIYQLNSSMSKRSLMMTIKNLLKREFPKHIGEGTYELSDGSQLRGKRAAMRAESRLSGTKAEAPLEPVPKVKKLRCPRCKSDVLTQIRAAGMEAAESAEPSHRKVVGVKTLPAIYECVPCGKRIYA